MDSLCSELGARNTLPAHVHIIARACFIHASCVLFRCSGMQWCVVHLLIPTDSSVCCVFPQRVREDTAKYQSAVPHVAPAAGVPLPPHLSKPGFTRVTAPHPLPAQNRQPQLPQPPAAGPMRSYHSSATHTHHYHRPPHPHPHPPPQPYAGSHTHHHHYHHQPYINPSHAPFPTSQPPHQHHIQRYAPSSGAHTTSLGAPPAWQQQPYPHTHPYPAQPHLHHHHQQLNPHGPLPPAPVQPLRPLPPPTYGSLANSSGGVAGPSHAVQPQGGQPGVHQPCTAPESNNTARNKAVAPDESTPPDAKRAKVTAAVVVEVHGLQEPRLVFLGTGSAEPSKYRCEGVF